MSFFSGRDLLLLLVEGLLLGGDPLLFRLLGLSLLRQRLFLGPDLLLGRLLLRSSASAAASSLAFSISAAFTSAALFSSASFLASSPTVCSPFATSFCFSSTICVRSLTPLSSRALSSSITPFDVSSEVLSALSTSRMSFSCQGDDIWVCAGPLVVPRRDADPLRVEVGEHDGLVLAREVVEVPAVHGIVVRDEEGQEVGIPPGVAVQRLEVRRDDAAHVVDMVDLRVRVQGDDVRAELLRLLGPHDVQGRST